ncbi:hypothetical protein COE59_31180 [Bacillus wiedmannii]|nr:hypothetical protein COE59_31180 [Bacillus wiedmannii]
MVRKKKADYYFHKEYTFLLFYDSIHLFIHSYPGAILRFSFVTGLSEKLYKTLHVLSLDFFRNTGCTLNSST